MYCNTTFISLIILTLEEIWHFIHILAICHKHFRVRSYLIQQMIPCYIFTARLFVIKLYRDYIACIMCLEFDRLETVIVYVLIKFSSVLFCSYYTFILFHTCIYVVYMYFKIKYIQTKYTVSTLKAIVDVRLNVPFTIPIFILPFLENHFHKFTTASYFFFCVSITITRLCKKKL